MTRDNFNIFVGPVVRALLVFVVGRLSIAGLIPQSAVAGWLETGTTVLLIIGWAVWNHYGAHALLVTSTQMPSGATVPEVKAQVANGLGASFTEVVAGGSQ